MAITLEELQIKFNAETGNLRSQLSGVQNQLGGLEKSAEKSKTALAGLMKGGLAVAGALAARKLANIGKDAVLMANDVVESEELFGVSMGRMEARAREWSDNIGESLGLNPYDLRKNAGMLNVMFGSMGAGEEEAYEMSTSLTQLANDMASFYNIDTEEAFTKLRAGITGETEPLKRLGILVDENTIKQYAMANGISKTGKEMTQTQKLQARYGAIMQQTMKAQGDLARTLDSPTNQLRVLNNQFDQAKIALGQALQPALIAVLPHVTNFATGLARLMRGELSGNPLSGSLLSLAGATDAIRSRIDTSIIGITEEVARLQEGTETAIDGYIQAASETRELYLNITMKPQNSVEDRIVTLFDELRGRVDEEALKAFEDEIEAHFKVALADGTVSSDERTEALAIIDKRIEQLKKEAEAELKAIQVDAKAKLNAKEIDLPTHDQMLADAQTEYDTTIGMIDALEAEAKAEVGISDWGAKTISADDRTKITAAINKEIAAGDAMLVTAQAQAQALFEGSSLETAVMGIYGGLTDKVKSNNEALQELLNGWYEGHEINWDEVWKLRQQNADALAIATGGLTAQGEVNKLVLGLGNATPEEIATFAKGYNEAFKPVAGSFKKIYDEQVNFIASLPDEYIEAQGTTRKGMYDTAKSEYDAKIAGASGTIIDAAMEGLAPQIYNLFNDTANANIFDVVTLGDAVGTLAKSMDAAGQDATKLWDLESQLGGLADWLDFSARDLDTRNKGMPDWWLDGPQLPLTQYYDPMAYENKGYKDLVFSGADITISNPRMKYQSLIDGFAVGGGGSFDVNVSVAPQDIVVNMYLDETQLGRANIRVTQTVTKSTGGGGSHVSVPFSTVPVLVID